MSDHKTTTTSGQLFDLLEPDPEQINLAEIITPLCRAQRYAGQTIKPLSVGAHSLILSRLVPRPLRAAALLHDAAEAYTGDITEPIKGLLPAATLNLLESVERGILQAIEDHLGLLFVGNLPAVMPYDQALAQLEMLHFYGRQPTHQALALIEPLTATQQLSRALYMTPDQIAFEFLCALCDLSPGLRKEALDYLTPSRN